MILHKGVDNMFEEVKKEIEWLFENKPHDISWAEVARQTGVDHRTISAYRLGKYDLSNANLTTGLSLYDFSLKFQAELKDRKYLKDIPNHEFIAGFDELKQCLAYDKHGAYFKSHYDYHYWDNKCYLIVGTFNK